MFNLYSDLTKALHKKGAKALDNVIQAVYEAAKIQEVHPNNYIHVAKGIPLVVAVTTLCATRLTLDTLMKVANPFLEIKY